MHVSSPCWRGAREVEGCSCGVLGRGSWFEFELPGFEGNSLEDIVVRLVPPPRGVAGLLFLATTPCVEQAEFLLAHEDAFAGLLLCSLVRCFLVACVDALRTVDTHVARDWHSEELG